MYFPPLPSGTYRNCYCCNLLFAFTEFYEFCYLLWIWRHALRHWFSVQIIMHMFVNFYFTVSPVNFGSTWQTLPLLWLWAHTTVSLHFFFLFASGSIFRVVMNWVADNFVFFVTTGKELVSMTICCLQHLYRVLGLYTEQTKFFLNCLVLKLNIFKSKVMFVVSRVHYYLTSFVHRKFSA